MTLKKLTKTASKLTLASGSTTRTWLFNEGSCHSLVLPRVLSVSSQLTPSFVLTFDALILHHLLSPKPEHPCIICLSFQTEIVYLHFIKYLILTKSVFLFIPYMMILLFLNSNLHNFWGNAWLYFIPNYQQSSWCAIIFQMCGIR